MAQIEGIPTAESLEKFRKGVTIKIEKKLYDTLPADCQPVADPSVYFSEKPLWERSLLPKASGNKPMSWLEVTLTEGKNRQVRRMCSAIGHPCLRLIRVSIMDLKLGNLQPNEVKELEHNEMLNLLKM